VCKQEGPRFRGPSFLAPQDARKTNHSLFRPERPSGTSSPVRSTASLPRRAQPPADRQTQARGGGRLGVRTGRPTRLRPGFGGQATPNRRLARRPAAQMAAPEGSARGRRTQPTGSSAWRRAHRVNVTPFGKAHHLRRWSEARHSPATADSGVAPKGLSCQRANQFGATERPENAVFSAVKIRWSTTHPQHASPLERRNMAPTTEKHATRP